MEAFFLNIKTRNCVEHKEKFKNAKLSHYKIKGIKCEILVRTYLIS